MPWVDTEPVRPCFSQVVYLGILGISPTGLIENTRHTRYTWFHFHPNHIYSNWFVDIDHGPGVSVHASRRSSEASSKIKMWEGWHGRPLQPEEFLGFFGGLAYPNPAYKTVHGVFLRVSGWAGNRHAQTETDKNTYIKQDLSLHVKALVSCKIQWLR
jgi:hypothetical protein